MNNDRTLLIIIICSLVGFARKSYAINIGTSVFTGDSIENKTDSTAWNVTLDEATVTAKYIIKDKDKLMIFPTKDMKNNSFDGYSILSMLMIPGLDADEFDRTIKTRNKDATVCINGRQVEVDEIRTLNPKDIKRIDYYQQKDPRFPMAASVVDFIMKNRDHGGQIYLSAQEKLNVVSGDDMIDIKHFFKKAELNLQVAGNYTHFTQSRGVEQTTSMQFPDQTVTKSEITKSSPQHKNNINAKLSFLRRYGEKDMLQLAAYIKNGHNSNGSNFTETFSNGVEGSSAYDNQHTDNTAASFNSFFQKTFNETWQIRAWLRGRYNHTDIDREKFSVSQFNSTNKEDYYSISPSIGWLRVKKGQLFNPFLSVDFYYDKAKGSYIENGIEDPNRLTNIQGIIAIGNNFHFGDNYRICLEPDIQWLQTNNDGVKETRWSFSPKMWINLDLPKNNFIGGFLGIAQETPEVKYYNDTEHTLDPYQKYRGNPNLKSGMHYSTYIEYGHFGKWGMFRFYTNYGYVTNNRYQWVEYDENRYLFVRNYLNGAASLSFNMTPELQLKLIKNKLRLQTSLEYKYQEERNYPDLKLNTVRFIGELQYINKAFSSKLRFKTPERRLAGGYEIKTPVSLRLSMGYTYKGWHFTFDTSNPFMKSYVKTKFVADKYTLDKRAYSPRVAYNTFSLSVAYRISYGKEHKFSNVDVDKTEDSAILTQ